MDSARRLDGWKEIANHLNRDVRTVQRWEKELGLPIRRTGGAGRPSIFAYASEIDSWLTERDQSQKMPVQWRRWVGWIPAAGILVIGIAWGIAAWWDDASPQPPATAWLLIVPFENETSIPELDRMFEASLRHQLINRGFSRVASEARVRDAVKLIGESADQRVDVALAQKIADWDPGIGLLLLGELYEADEGFGARMRLVEAASGRLLGESSQSITLPNPAPGLTKSSDWVLAQLRVEPPVAIRAIPNEATVTDPDSFRAVHLYNMGLDALHQEDRRTAETLFRDALNLDPDFASAFIYLAWVVRSNTRGESQTPEVYLQYVEKAVALADAVSDPERHFILGSQAQLLGDFDGAVPHYRAVLALAPGHFWAARNLLFVSEQRGDFESAVHLSYQMPEARPWDPRANSYAIEAAVAWDGDFARAREYVDRLREWTDRNPGSRNHELFITNFEIFKAWYENDLAAVQHLVDSLIAKVEETLGWERRDLVWRGGFWYLALGQFERAERLFRLAEKEHPPYFLAVSAVLKGDLPAAESNLDVYWGSEPGYYLGSASMLSAHVGLSEPLEEHLAVLEENPLRDPAPENVLAFFRGAVAASQHKTSEAIEYLETAMGGNPSESRVQIAWLLLVDLLAAEGREQEAIQYLRRFPRSAFFPWGAPFWVAGQIRLAELLRKSSDPAAAALVERELAVLLAGADHPQ